MLYFYKHLPQYINPIAFTVGSFSVRWYALSYLVCFGVVYGLLRWRINHEPNTIAQISNSKFLISNQTPNPKSKTPNENSKVKIQMSNVLIDFLLVAFFSSLVGGRIGYVLFYNFSYFISHPLAVISPYENGNFTGIYGMSYHGALIWILIGSYIFLRVKKIKDRKSVV